MLLIPGIVLMHLNRVYDTKEIVRQRSDKHVQTKLKIAYIIDSAVTECCGLYEAFTLLSCN